jgi:hypothetical protein
MGVRYFFDQSIQKMGIAPEFWAILLRVEGKFYQAEEGKSA